MKAPKRNSGFGWVGTWIEGKLGWVMPTFVTGPGFRAAERTRATVDFVGDDDVFYKCRITITPVRSKTGKVVTRRYRSLKDKS